MHLPALAGSVHLRVSGAGIQTRVLRVHLPWRDEPMAAEVAPGARMTGSLGPLQAVLDLDPLYDPKAKHNIYSHQHGFGATLTAVSGAFRREDIRLDHLGRFCIDGLPPGPVELGLSVWLRQGPNSYRQAPAPIPLGTFQVEPGKPLEVTLKVPNR
jgi:hypothetical protein